MAASYQLNQRLSDTAAEYVVRGLDEYRTNQLRRYLMLEARGYALGDVTFLRNSSVYHNEMLADRLALLPLRTAAITASGANATVIWKTDHPGTHRRHVYVLASDSIINAAHILVYPDSLLVKLGPGQGIHATARITQGSGRDHVKYRPVTVVSFDDAPDQPQGTFFFRLESVGDRSCDELFHEAWQSIVIKNHHVA